MSMADNDSLWLLPKEEVEGAAGLTKEGVSELTATRTPSSSSSLSETAVSSTGPLISISDQYSLNPDPSGNRNPVLDTSCFLTMPGSGINTKKCLTVKRSHWKIRYGLSFNRSMCFLNHFSTVCFKNKFILRWFNIIFHLFLRPWIRIRIPNPEPEDHWIRIQNTAFDDAQNGSFRRWRRRLCYDSSPRPSGRHADRRRFRLFSHVYFVFLLLARFLFLLVAADLLGSPQGYLDLLVLRRRHLNRLCTLRAGLCCRCRRLLLLLLLSATPASSCRTAGLSLGLRSVGHSALVIQKLVHIIRGIRPHLHLHKRNQNRKGCHVITKKMHEVAKKDEEKNISKCTWNWSLHNRQHFLSSGLLI